VIVAEHDGEVLGFIAIHALPRFEHDDRIVRVVALVVDAGVRERGVGHLLMEEAENVGRELGAAFTEVTAGHHRPDAHRLYESLGYDATVTTYLRKKL
jgi:GNAT superfamily N-acetyltransferase